MGTNLQMYHRILKQICQWLPKERITRQKNMALTITGLYLSRAVHLAHIVRKWPLVNKEPSSVNRLRRFLDNERVDVRRWYRPLAREVLSSFAGVPMRLILDCTKVGLDFRLMTVSIAYRKRTLPLVWSVHRGRKGHTTAQEQVALLQYIYSLIPAQHEVWVMGDTGFQSVPLLAWLSGQGWHFVIRQQGRLMVQQPEQAWRKLNQYALSPGETRSLGWVRLTRKHQAGPFWLLLHWEKGAEEPWYLISDCPDKRTLIRLYKLRMWTEEMYGDMKGHGFDLEATHLDDADRIARLVLAVCITFVWLIALGSWVVKNGYRHFVDHKSRRDKSYFRIGWDWLERRLRLGEPFQLRFNFYT